MSRLVSAVLLMGVTAIAFGQVPRIVSVTPSSGPASGLTQVIVRVKDVNLGCPVTTCQVARVAFGGITGVTTVIDGESLSVIAPAHAPGVVDVTLTPPSGSPISAPSAFTYVDPALVYEKVLVPITFHGPGALGSEWRSEIYVHNDGQDPIETGSRVFSNPTCPGPCGCDARNNIDPNETLTISECTVPSDPSGLILYIPRADDSLRIQERVRDISRSTTDWGTEIPIARESDFRVTPFSLLNIPTDPRFRLTLRIYNPDQLAGPQVAILMRIFANTGSEPLVEAEINPRYDIVTLLPDYTPNRPSYAQINLNDAYPQISEAATIRIELTPLASIIDPPQPTPRFWGFVTITNNDTQHVTTVSPQ